METIIASGPLILQGLLITLQVSVFVLSIGTVIGILGGLSLLYGPRLLRLVVRFYVDTIRGIPLLVLIFAIFYGFPVLGLRVPAIIAAIIALSVFCGAHISEVVRGGVDSIPKGQTEAAKAIGLTFRQSVALCDFAAGCQPRHSALGEHRCRDGQGDFAGLAGKRGRPDAGYPADRRTDSRNIAAVFRRRAALFFHQFHHLAGGSARRKTFCLLLKFGLKLDLNAGS